MHLIVMTAASPLAQPAIREEPVPCGRQKVASALYGRITGDPIVEFQAVRGAGDSRRAESQWMMSQSR